MKSEAMLVFIKVHNKDILFKMTIDIKLKDITYSSSLPSFTGGTLTRPRSKTSS